jgi:hypothetical protein
MKEAIYYMYREILLSVWDAIIKRDRYKEYYQNIPTLERDINDLEPKFKQILEVDFDIKLCEDLYNEVYLHNFLGDFMDYAKSDLEDNGVETGKRDDDYQYPSKELAVPITGLDNYYLGFTSYYGGGKYDDGSWKPDITENCYLLTARDEVKVIKVFEKC